MISSTVQQDSRAAALNKFVDEVASALSDGYHFVPFLGAGFSQEAGFPTTPQLRDHLLPYWIIRALDLNPFADSAANLYEFPLTTWNPVDAWWPAPGDEILGLKGQGVKSPLFNQRQAQWVILRALYDLWKWEKDSGVERQIAPDTLKQAADLLCGSTWVNERKREWESRYNRTPFTPNEKVKEPMGADWLKLVHFLSRITRRTQYEAKVHVGPPRQSVVDSLFMHLDAQCRPGLAQMMLAALTKTCRIRTILTTNFDTLVERAYDDYRKAMEVFEVPRAASLPNNRLVLAQPSIVKLHGGRFDVRADLSVGSPLDRADFMNAVSYVAGRTLFKNGDLGPTIQHSGKAALLFMGCGDEDERTRDLAQYVARHLKETKVFWISLSEKDPSTISVLGLFGEERKCVCSYPEFGSFLLLLYQRLTGSIPPSGAIFPGPWQLISPPRIPRQEPSPYEEPRSKAEELLRTKLSGRMRAYYHQKALPIPLQYGATAVPFTAAKPLHLVLNAGDYSAAGICVPLFHDLVFQRKERCRMVWIDMHDVTMPAGIFTRLVMILARVQGVFDPLTTLHLESLTNRDSEYERLRVVMRHTLIRHYANTGLALVVFLSGQELPGQYGMYRVKNEDEGGDGNRWRTRELEHILLWEVIEEINSCAACATQFVIVAPATYDVTGHMQTFVPNGRAEQVSYDPLAKATGFDPCESARRAITWIEDSLPVEREKRLTFLLALLCLRQSGYPSEIARILSEIFSADQFGMSNEHELFEHITGREGWLEQLDSARVLRFRDGGFIWMNCQVIRNLMESSIWRESGTLRLAIRALLGRWYGRLLFSSQDPLSAVEGIYQNITGVKDAVANSSGNCWKLAAMIDNALMLLDASRRLFEARLTSTFADRSLQVSRELVDETSNALVKSDVFKESERATLLGRLTRLARELNVVRDMVSIREGRFRQLTVLPDYCFSANPDGLIVQGAAWLHLRRYSRAISLLMPAWKTVTGLGHEQWEVIGEIGTPDEAVIAAQKFSMRIYPNGDDGFDDAKPLGAKRLAIRLARWGLYLHLNSSQVQWVLSEVSIHAELGLKAELGGYPRIREEALKARRHALKRALWFFHFGAELLRSMTYTRDGFVFDEGIRFRAHGALAQALLEATQDRQGCTLKNSICWGARRTLRDAESFMGDYPIKEPGVAEAMLKLRAGEVELIEVMSIKAFEVARAIVRDIVRRDFAALGDGKETHLKKHEVFMKRVRESDSEGVNLTDEDWTICGRRVSDALVELDRAEELLAQHPKSRWWWWILAVLKSRAVEYLYTLRFIRAVSSMHGFDATPNLIAPPAFRFVNHGLARIVLEKDLGDPFYLGRVVSSLTTIIRMDYNFASLRPPPEGGGSSPYMKAWTQNVRQRIGLSIVTLEGLAARLRESLEESNGLAPEPLPAVTEYAAACLDRVDKLVNAWEPHRTE